MLGAIETSWEAIRPHKETMRNLVERILRDGIAAGEFGPIEPRKASELILRSLVCFTHPVLVGQCLEEGEDLEAAARDSVRFLVRAIAPRN